MYRERNWMKTSKVSIFIVLILFIISINIGILDMGLEKPKTCSNTTAPEILTPKFSAPTSINFSESSSTPTFVNINTYYKSTNSIWSTMYIGATLETGEVYLIYCDDDFWNSNLYLYDDSGFSNLIGDHNDPGDRRLAFTPHTTKTYYIKWTNGNDATASFGIIKAVKYTADEIMVGVNTIFINDDWELGLTYFTMPDTSGCSDKYDIKITMPKKSSYSNSWYKITANSGNTVQFEHISSGYCYTDYGEMTSSMLNNPGSGFLIVLREEGFFQLTLPPPLPPIDWGIIISIILLIITIFGGITTIGLYVNKQKKRDLRIAAAKAIEDEKRRKEKLLLAKFEDLITNADIMIRESNYSSALQKLNESFKIANENRKLVSITKLNDIESKIKLAKDELTIEIENKVKISIKNGEEFEKKKKFEETLKSYRTALEYLDDLHKSKERGLLIKNLKSKIDNIYFIKIGELEDQAEELKNRGKLYNAIKSYKMAIKEAENMYYTSHRNKEIENFNYYINQTYLDMLKPNIDKAHKLRDEFKYDGAIKNYNEAMQIALNLTDKSLKSKNVREIRRYINEVKVAIIKSTILDMGTKFGRLEVGEVAEECGEDEELIVKTVKEMIEGNEIYAKYFDSSRAVAFNLQANIDEIDNLMDKYKQWEKEDKDKV